MIQVKGLTKYYGEHAAIQNLNFSIEQGEVIGFLGLNGAGKTTLLRITLAMNGFRMSARTNSARPIRRVKSLLGAIASTAITCSIDGFCTNRAVR